MLTSKPTYRVLIFGMEFPPSATGSAIYAARLATGLARRGVDVQVLAPATGDGNDAVYDENQPFEIIRMPHVRLVPKRYLVARRWLQRAVAGLRPDILWATNGLACRVSGITAIPTNTHLIASIRGSDIVRRLPGRGLWTRIESVPQRWCYLKSKAIAAASGYLRTVAIAKGVDQDKIFISPSAVDLEQLETLSKKPHASGFPDFGNQLVVLTVARLVEQKRVDLVVRAFREIADNFPDSCLVIVGDGPARSMLETQVGASGFGARIQLLGALEPMSAALFNLYRQATIFMMLGVGEGMPNVFMEAGAFGLPCIGANSGGTPEIVRDGETGLLAAKDNVVDAAAKLRHLMVDANLREEFGKRARERIAARFSLANLSDTSYQIVERVVQQG